MNYTHGIGTLENVNRLTLSVGHPGVLTTGTADMPERIACCVRCRKHGFNRTTHQSIKSVILPGAGGSFAAIPPQGAPKNPRVWPLQCHASAP
jgi:hypothetical protein